MGSGGPSIQNVILYLSNQFYFWKYLEPFSYILPLLHLMVLPCHIHLEGVVTVAAPDEESRNIAMQMIKDITAKAELNKIYSGKVMKIMEFGAFVNFLGKQDGLVHISELAPKRVEKVTDVVKEGDEVKVIGFDRGKVTN